MGTEGQPLSRARRHAVTAASAAALLLVLFVAGLTFANSVGAARVAENAASLHWANSAAGTSALTRAALSQAVTFSDLHAQDMATDADLAFAMEQVDVSISELASLIGLAGGSGSAELLEEFLEGVEATDSVLEGGNAASATQALSELEALYIRLADSLEGEQEAVQRAISDNTAAAARINSYVVFVLTFAIPATAVLVYWRIARRQMRELKVKSELEIEAERTVSRAKDSFIAGLSHELRTPLTSIYGFAEILTDEVPTDPDQTSELAQIIANEAAEMSRMVDDLLAASRFESTGMEVEMAPVRVSSVVESAIAPFERAGLTLKWAPTNDMVTTDAARLRHVLVNLISNAVRHGGSSIGVEVTSSDETVDIEVWDNGPGVPDERLASLFQLYAHDGPTSLLTGSVGLGLAVASRITDKLGGRLVYQRFGGKSYFVVTLPRYSVVDDVIDVEVGDGDGDKSELESVSDVIRAMSS
jgi:signal transduction histidine kinase